MDATGALQALTNPKSILPQTFSALHSHILTWTCDVINHYCDTCRKSFQVTHYFRCAGCDFDLCVPCFLMKDTRQDQRLYDLCYTSLKFIPSVLLLLIVDYISAEKGNETNWDVSKSHIPQGVRSKGEISPSEHGTPSFFEQEGFVQSQPSRVGMFTRRMDAWKSLCD